MDNRGVGDAEKRQFKSEKKESATKRADLIDNHKMVPMMQLLKPQSSKINKPKSRLNSTKT